MNRNSISSVGLLSLPFRGLGRHKSNEKTCLIDIGGGLRGIYATGVLDRLMDEGVQVDLCIGVSAGSANLATYLAGQRGRCYTYYHDYSFRPEYYSLHNFWKHGSVFDFDYIYSTLSNSDGEYPLDYKALEASGTELIVVATNAITGNPAYLDRSWIRQDEYSIFKGSCAVPFLCRPWRIGQIPFCDGTVSDPIPIQKALDLGATKIVVLFPRDPSLDQQPSPINAALLQGLSHSRYARLYPAVVGALEKRDALNASELALARDLEAQGKLMICAPDSLYGVRSLRATPEAIDDLYRAGYDNGMNVALFLNGRQKDEDHEHSVDTRC